MTDGHHFSSGLAEKPRHDFWEASVGNLITTNKSVSQVIDDFESGDLAIPEIQRDVVWTAQQVKSLIDSISEGYPCGALIYWEPREKDHQLVKSMIRPERLELYEGHLPRYFLLDGQQRVTSLASIFLERGKLRDLLAELEGEMPYIFVNLKQPFPRDIEATSDSSGYNPPWILFNKLFDNSYQTESAFAQLPDTKKAVVRSYIQRIRDYQFPVQIIRDHKYEDVAEIFTRVNSEGTRLTGAEIHLARIVPHWKGITREFRDYRRELAQENYDLDLTFLMRSITAIECNLPRIEKLADKIAKDQPSRASLNKTWRRARAAIDRMIRIFQKELGLDKSKYFTSKNALVPLVYSLANINGGRRLERAVVRFFILSQLAEHYGAAAETTLRRDFRVLADYKDTPLQGFATLVDIVNCSASVGSGLFSVGG